ncbi:MAG: hypothetical protein ACKVX7_13390 [Planctomycetota bacterium]
MRPSLTLLVCALVVGLGACTTQSDSPTTTTPPATGSGKPSAVVPTGTPAPTAVTPPTATPPPTAPAPTELIRRLEEERRQKEQRDAAANAAVGAMRPEVEQAAKDFFAAIVKDDLASAQAQILDEAGVNESFKPSMASILLAGRSAKIEKEWREFQARRAGAALEFARVEIGAIEKVDNKSPAFAKSLDHCDSAKIFYKSGGGEKAIELKTGLKSAKGWRFLQVFFGE